MGYLDLQCQMPGPFVDQVCGASVYLAIHSTVDAFDDRWTHRVGSWEIECQEAHVHATSADLHGDDENPPLPTTTFAASLPLVASEASAPKEPPSE